MLYEFGDVAAGAVPFTNQVAAKQGPAVIVSAAVQNRTKPDVVVMAIHQPVPPQPNLREGMLGHAVVEIGLRQRPAEHVIGVATIIVGRVSKAGDSGSHFACPGDLDISTVKSTDRIRVTL
jgi:hypothetical protein